MTEFKFCKFVVIGMILNFFQIAGEMPCLEPPMTHASSVEDVELTDEDEEVDITDTDLGNQAPIPDDGSIVGKDVKLDPELDLMKSSNLIKVSLSS